MTCDAVFRTFWHGADLTWLSAMCLARFVAKGHAVELYSYAPVSGVPEGVVVRDAAQILPCEQVSLYRVGKDQLSGAALHANLFRYKMLRDIGGWWIDADILLLGGEIPPHATVFAWDDWPDDKRRGFNTAILRFPAGSEIMARAYDEAAALIASNPKWGVTGPYLFTRLVEEMGLQHLALPQSTMYALPYTEAYKFVSATHREEVEQRTRGAPFVHLYQHMLRVTRKADRLPDNNSFLAAQLRFVNDRTE